MHSFLPSEMCVCVCVCVCVFAPVRVSESAPASHLLVNSVPEEM